MSKDVDGFIVTLESLMPSRFEAGFLTQELRADCKGTSANDLLAKRFPFLAGFFGGDTWASEGRLPFLNANKAGSGL